MVKRKIIRLLTTLVAVPLTLGMFTQVSADNVVESFVNSQKEFTVGAYVGVQSIMKQAFPETSEVHQFHANNERIATSGVNTDSVAYEAGVMQGVGLELMSATKGGKALSKWTQ